MRRVYNIRKTISTAGKKLTGAVMVLALLATIALPLVPKKADAAALTAAPRISFTFDDGLASALNLAAPALQKHGYTGTDYITSGCIGMTTAPNTCPADNDMVYMSWANVKSLHDTYGWEIGSHTVTHPLLASTSDDQPAKLTNAQIVAELANSKAAIKANTGLDATAFASPYGDYDPSGNPVLAEVAKHYTSHRGFADVGYNVFPYNDYLLVNQQVQAGVSVDTVKGYIDQAVAGNTWLILTFHEIKNGNASTNPEDYQYNVADLEAIAAYARTKNIANVNVSDGVAANNGNLVANSSFDTAPSANTADTTVWSTTQPTNATLNTGNNGSYSSTTNSLYLTSIDSIANTNVSVFSPQVPVSPKPYVIKAFVNITQIAPTGEVAFYVDEYDANGAYLSTQYKKAWSIFAVPNPLAKEFTFEYTPSANAARARLQVVAVNNSTLKCYIDNVQWFAQDGSTTGGSGGGTTTAKAGDTNADNLVDALDLSSLLSNWSKTGATRAQGDMNADGVIDALDLSTVLSNWSK